MSLFEFYLTTFNSDKLREFVRLCGGPNNLTRKEDRARFLAGTMSSATEVRRLWGKLSTLEQKAVAVAFHNDGVFDADIFIAQYGSLPPRPKKNTWSWETEAIVLDLFLVEGSIPPQIMPLLAAIAPPPDPFQISGISSEPPQVMLHKQPVPQTIALREENGRYDLLIFLGLCARGDLKLSSTSLRLTPKSVTTLLAQLTMGDFIDFAEKADDTILCFGLTTFAFQAGLIDSQGQLQELGKRYLATEAPGLLFEALENWSEANAFDEITRIKCIRGLRTRGLRLTRPAERRQKIIEALSWCPTGVWIKMDDFYRGLKIWHFDFEIEEGGLDKLYIGTGSYYRDAWASSHSQWLLTTGLYVNAVLWETLASIGAIDIVYAEDGEDIFPAEAYTYDDSVYSAYDGLLYFRINPLGAFLFGQAGAYTPTRTADEALFALSPAGHVALLRPQELSVAHRAQIEQMADPAGAGYQLSVVKLLQALEVSATLETQRAFLAQRHRGPLPAEIVALFDRVETDSKALTIQAKSLTIRVRSAEIAQKVMDDPVAGKIARRLDDRTLLIPASRERAFRQALHLVGYGLA